MEIHERIDYLKELVTTIESLLATTKDKHFAFVLDRELHRIKKQVRNLDILRGMKDDNC